MHFTFSPQDAAHIVANSLTVDDLVLVKGSRAVGMDVIVPEITGDNASSASGAQEAQRR